MSKQKAKKPPLSEEERRARMAALTSDVAAVNLLDGGTVPTAPLPVTQPAPTVAPAATAPAPPAVPAMPVLAATNPAAAAPAAVAQPDAPAAADTPVTTSASAEPAEEKSAAPVGPQTSTTAEAAPAPDPGAAPASVSSTPDLQREPAAAGRVGEPAGETAAPVGLGRELDLTSLFAPSTEKKTTTLRITAGHQQFFNQLGLVLGNGASAPDIIHNILMQFRQQHEAALGKLVKKALARQFK